MSIFSTVKTPRVPLNKFNLSHDVKLSAKMGSLYPILCQEVVPGDRFRITSDMLIRLMPMSSPAFGNLRVYTHFFFVPNRIIWDKWEDFITGGPDGTTSIVPPYIRYAHLIEMANRLGPSRTDVGVGMLFDYFGIPISPTGSSADQTPISALPFMAYRQIYNEYYRDQNVDEEFSLDYWREAEGNLHSWTSIPEAANYYLYTLLFRRRYLKDYFTSALPTPQRGPDVTLPVGGDVDVMYNPSGGDGVHSPRWRSYGEHTLDATTGQPMRVAQNVGTLGSSYVDPNEASTTSSRTTLLAYDPQGTLKADLSTATAVTVNDLRRAISLQRFYEISARSGSRYIEQIYGHFHVRSSDARLQRPEYLGGGVTPIQIGEVLQTSATDATSPQANMAGRGIGFARSNKAVFRAEEHGHIIGIMSIVPESTYFQGVNKSWSRLTRDDYYWPSFANLGEQPIEKQELLVGSTSNNYGELFGYAPRYSEYKYAPNRLSGLMRTSLRNWTFSRELVSANLNSAFLEIPSVNNPFAVQDDTDKFIIWVSHRIDALRPMPYFGTPSIL